MSPAPTATSRRRRRVLRSTKTVRPSLPAASSGRRGSSCQRSPRPSPCDDDVARASLERGAVVERLDEDVDLAAARQPDAPGLRRRRSRRRRARAIAPESTALARSQTSASTQPPETEPNMRPSDVTASFEPSGRGALRAGADDGRERNVLTLLRATPLPLRAPRPCRDDASDEHVGRRRRARRAAGPGRRRRARRPAAGARLSRRAVGVDRRRRAERRAAARRAARRRGRRSRSASSSVDDRAVKSLAADLYNDDRRAQLARSLDALVLRVRDLPVAREAALFLVTDVDLAWRHVSRSRCSPRSSANDAGGARRRGAPGSSSRCTSTRASTWGTATTPSPSQTALGRPAGQLFKTLVVSVDGDLRVFVVPADRQLDLRSVGKRATMADRAAGRARDRLCRRRHQPARAAPAAADGRRRLRARVGDDPGQRRAAAACRSSSRRRTWSR